MYQYKSCINPRNGDLKILAQIQHVYTVSISKKHCHQKRFLASKYPQNAFARCASWIREMEGKGGKREEDRLNILTD